jgi:hypothetical protein
MGLALAAQILISLWEMWIDPLGEAVKALGLRSVTSPIPMER